MESYKSTSGKKSGIKAYEIGKSSIKVEFSRKTYKYTYFTAGKDAIETMKSLAMVCKGLSTFIAQHHPKYV